MALSRAKVTETATETKAADVAEKVAQDTTGQETQVINKDEVNQALAEAKGVEPEAAQQAEPAAETGAEPEATQQAEPAAETAQVAEAKPEPQAEQFEQTAVATRSESTAVAAPGAAPGAMSGAMAKFKDDMASEGFEGMNLTGMSFDRVKLHEGQFLLGSEETKLGELIHVQIMSTREIYVVRQFSGNGAEMFYSYDKAGKFKTDGSSAQEVLDEWLEDGYGTPEQPLEIKTYIEAMAVLVNRTDDYEQHMVSLSIPPASKDRLAGAFAVGRQRLQAGPTQLVIECKVGAKVGSGEEAFRPWIFKAHSKAE